MHTIWKLILLFAITLLIFTIYSFTSVEFKIGSAPIEKTNIKDIIIGDTLVPTGKMAMDMNDAENKRKNETPVMDSTAQRILLIGDSMLEGLMWRLKDYTEFNGHEMKPVIWYSSQSEWYGKYDTLRYYIKSYKPTYVMLVLGANELFVGDIINKRTRYVKRIIQQMDTVKFVWIGPPNWKDDTGINKMILDNVGERQYFPSKNLTYKRYKDGAHPTRESSSVWMDSIAVWVMTKSQYPILLNKPVAKAKGTPNATLLQPLK